MKELKYNGFRTELGFQIFRDRYQAFRGETWKQRAQTIVADVCGRRSGTTSIHSHPLMGKDDLRDLEHFIENFMFVPGGRYIYYSGRGVSFFNNCQMYRAEEDTREEWGRLLHSISDALMSGAGVGCDYSILRSKGQVLSRTGGVSSGPLPLLASINEVGRNVRQGGARRSAIYGSLNWQHGDIEEFLTIKDWANTCVPGAGNLTYFDLKNADFDAHAPLDSTNISVNYDDDWLNGDRLHSTFLKNVEMALRNGEPGFSFNFGDKRNETLRNACCELSSSDDSDICNLGSINLANIPDLAALERAVELGTKFLICGTIRGAVPDAKTLRIREKNRRLGLGIMGVHEWLLRRGWRYAMNDELRQWLNVYRDESRRAADEHADRFYLNRPVGCRAIAPTGTIGLLTGSTTGIEPLYAVAYKRRWVDGNARKYKYVIDQTAKDLIRLYDVEPDTIETALTLAETPGRRIAFQAEIQPYVDHCISSTVNLPAWGSKFNNEDTVLPMAQLIAKYAPQIRGLTFYPDGARGGQPITAVPYQEALAACDCVFEEHSEQQCKSGVCGV